MSVGMRVNTYSRLLLFVLGSSVSAAIKHEIIEEKKLATLRCPHAVEDKVTWSRETNGTRVDILTVDGDREEKHIKNGRFSSVADPFKSLHISSVTISESGRYFCNDEAVVELTVIPSGTTRRSAEAKTSIDLKCLSEFTGSRVPKWTRQKSGTNITVYPQNNEVQHMTRFLYSTKEKMLTITQVQRDDAGLYYCDGKPVLYLDVMEDEQPDADRSEGRAAVLVPAVLLPLLLIMVIIIFVTWRCSIRRRGGGGEQTVEVVYAETSNIPAFESAQDGSNQEVMYSVIQDLPPPRNMILQPNETVYSQVS
ncbi:uncharacterized protein AB9X84_006594 isoform 1-T1 [Acanthopagrus schlegelii]